ncbi:uncharacterized protein L201_004621 [Kwoniella dendrophila CBS 6074]|uniref:SET domain-containing protein n=1 Tax=Kwoniella dendrophila CBS 6074 TaxID=1295534 RepID=A0AAX4JW80_9TREE
MQSDVETWDNLLKWLEEKHPGFEYNLSLRDVPGVERGLVAPHDLKKGDTLLHIPSTCMLNPLTLMSSPNQPIPLHLFPQTNRSSSTSSTTPVNKKPRTSLQLHQQPSRKLDTTQLLTLHLALTKDPKERYKSYWKPYIDSLPKKFRPWHPLTWIIPLHQSNHDDKDDKEWEWWNNLYELGLSKSTKLKVEDVKKRFNKDYDVLIDVLREEEPFKSHNLIDVISQEDILWAWLNVNTRSISIPLGLSGPSERNNHTLVPIMDFINHSSNETIITPRVKQLPTPSSSVSKTRKSSTSTSESTNKMPQSAIISNGNSNNSISTSAINPATTSASNGVNNGFSLRKAEQHLLPNKIDFRLLCPEKGLDKDEEVYFEYGGHSSSTLFAEYGFCEIPKSDDIPKPTSSSIKNGEHPIKDKLNKEKILNGNKDNTLGRETLDGDTNNIEKSIDEQDDKLNGWLNMKYGEVDLTSYINELWENQDEKEKEEKKQVLEDIDCWGGNTIHSQPLPTHPSHSLLMTLRLIHLSLSSTQGNNNKLSSISRGLITYISLSNENQMLISLENILKQVINNAEKRLKKINKLIREVDKSEEENKIFKEKQSVLNMLLAMCEEEKVICQSLLERLEKGEDLS